MSEKSKIDDVVHELFSFFEENYGEDNKLFSSLSRRAKKLAYVVGYLYTLYEQGYISKDDLRKALRF
jgi:hypothetical protein